MKRRIALYIFYSKDGYVGEYVKYYIKALKEVSDRIIFIVNGQILSDGSKEIESLGAEIFMRENKGLDFGAWKEAILSIGFPEIGKYDELILCNCSTYGPVYPLSEVFSEMESRKCDFWGITKHPYLGGQLISGDPSSTIIEHIQSYFIVFSNKVTESNAFHTWWSELEPTSDYLKEVAHHEIKFTQYLSNDGFSYDTYVDCDKYFRRNCPFNPCFACADEILLSDRVPFLKRKLFINEFNVWSETGEGFTPVKAMEELNQTDYPIQYIYSDLLRYQTLSSIKDGLALNWVHRKAEHYSKHKLALVCSASHADLAEYMVSYLLNMPDDADLYLISTQQEVLDAYKNMFEVQKDACAFSKVTYLLRPDRGHDAAALLVTFEPYVRNYEGFCFVHDIKSNQAPFTLSKDFMRRSLECCLESKVYANDLVEKLFDDSPKCGLMIPPTPYFSFCITIGAETSEGTSESLRALYDRLHLNVPFDDKTIAPFGSMFWARTDALMDLFDAKWSYEDFPENPAPESHTLFQAIERVFCYCAQNRGYFSQWTMPASFAEIYINNLFYRLRDYNAELNRLFGRTSWTGHLRRLRSLSPKDFTLAATAPAQPVQNTELPNEAVIVEGTFSYWLYIRYKLMYKLTFGNRKEHYRQKYMDLKRIKRERRINFF